MFVTKTQQALDLWGAGDIKGALRIFSTFRSGLTKEERDTLKIAFECMAGKADFYVSIGVDPEDKKLQAQIIVETKFNRC